MPSSPHKQQGLTMDVKMLMMVTDDDDDDDYDDNDDDILYKFIMTFS